MSAFVHTLGFLRTNCDTQDTGIPADLLSQDNLMATDHVDLVEVSSDDACVLTPQTSSALYAHHDPEYHPVPESTIQWPGQTTTAPATHHSDGSPQFPNQLHPTYGLGHPGSGVSSSAFLPSSLDEPMILRQSLRMDPHPPPSGAHIFSGTVLPSAPYNGSTAAPSCPLHETPHPLPPNANIDTQIFSIIGPLLSTVSQNFTALQASLHSEFQKIHEDITASRDRPNSLPTARLPSRPQKAPRGSNVHPRTFAPPRKTSSRVTSHNLDDDASSDERHCPQYDPYHGEPELNQYRVSIVVLHHSIRLHNLVPSGPYTHSYAALAQHPRNGTVT